VREGEEDMILQWVGWAVGVEEDSMQLYYAVFESVAAMTGEVHIAAGLYTE